MGLKSDIKKAFMESSGLPTSPQMDILAGGITDAIIKFLTKQTFTITEMKAILEVEEISTSGDMEANVKPNTLLGPYAPLFNGIKKIPGASSVMAPVEKQVGDIVKKVSQGGTVIPKIDYKKKGGQGGVMMSMGHAYIGRNPVDGSETNEDLTKVKLLEDNIVGE
jgi:hypothetical protein